MRDRLPYFVLSGLVAILAFVVYDYGGVVLNEWYGCLAGVALMSLLYWSTVGRDSIAPRLDRWLFWPVVLLPCYAAFQILPLPLWLLDLLSPDRAGLLSAMQQVIPGASVAPLSVVPGSGFRHVVQIAGYLVCFLLVRELGFRLRDRRWLVLAPIALIAFGEALFGIFQYVSRGQARGTYMNRNHFAGLLEMALPFASVACLGAGRRWWLGDDGVRNTMNLVVSGICAAALFLAILCSLSRGGLVASVLSLVVIASMGFETRRFRGWRKVAAVTVAGALVLCIPLVMTPDALVDRFRETGGSHDEDVRPILWAQTVNLIAAYPLFGCGLGGYESAFLKYKDVAPMLVADFAHNDYLQLLAEMGLVGFLLGATLCGAVLFGSIRAARFHPSLAGRLVALGCVAALVAIGIHSFVDFNLYIPANAMVLAWISGAAASVFGA